jgi:hypothetical protein
MIAGWWLAPHVATLELREGRGVPLPDWTSDIELAEAIGIKAWEIDAIPLGWYQRYQVFFSARAIVQREREKQKR